MESRSTESSSHQSSENRPRSLRFDCRAGPSSMAMASAMRGRFRAPVPYNEHCPVVKKASPFPRQILKKRETSMFYELCLLVKQK